MSRYILGLLLAALAADAALAQPGFVLRERVQRPPRLYESKQRITEIILTPPPPPPPGLAGPPVVPVPVAGLPVPAEPAQQPLPMPAPPDDKAPAAAKAEKKVEPGLSKQVQLPTRDWLGGRSFVDNDGNRWVLLQGAPVQDPGATLAGWYFVTSDGQTFFLTTAGSLFRQLGAVPSAVPAPAGVAIVPGVRRYIIVPACPGGRCGLPIDPAALQRVQPAQVLQGLSLNQALQQIVQQLQQLQQLQQPLNAPAAK